MCSSVPEGDSMLESVAALEPRTLTLCNALNSARDATAGVQGWCAADVYPLVIQWTYDRDVMVKKLTRHGNSLALVIDRPILDLLNIDTDTPLDLSTDGRRLIVAPAGQSARRRKFEAAQRTALKRYGKAFKKLAE